MVLLLILNVEYDNWPFSFSDLSSSDTNLKETLDDTGESLSEPFNSMKIKEVNVQ